MPSHYLCCGIPFPEKYGKYGCANCNGDNISRIIMRVQIPAYTDRWMMGDRYGEVVKVTKSGKTVRVLLTDCEVV